MRRLAAILAASLAACGGGSISVDDFFNSTNAQAANVAICGVGIAPEYASTFVSAFRNNEFTTDAKHAVASGRVKFDSAHARACLDKISVNPATCLGPSATVNFDRLPIDCQLIFTGTVADGGSCYGPTDCISGSCDQSGPRSVPGAGACPGKCKPTAHQGGSCTDGSCPVGLVCVTTGSGANTCQQPGGAGARCDSDFSCQTDLVCLNQACAARIAPGGSCLNTVDCASGLYCGPGQTCQARSDAGGPCTSGIRARSLGAEQCKGNQICLGATQGTPGRCATPQDVGGACSPAAGSAGLAAGCFTFLVCDAATSKCVLPPRTGQACPERLCDPTTAYCGGNGSCLATLADGQPCAGDEQCSGASTCLPNHTCGVRSIAGCREP